jgi:hypothetical protein
VLCVAWRSKERGREKSGWRTASWCQIRITLTRAENKPAGGRRASPTMRVVIAPGAQSARAWTRAYPGLRDLCRRSLSPPRPELTLASHEKNALTQARPVRRLHPPGRPSPPRPSPCPTRARGRPPSGCSSATASMKLPSFARRRPPGLLGRPSCQVRKRAKRRCGQDVARSGALPGCFRARHLPERAGHEGARTNAMKCAP